MSLKNELQYADSRTIVIRSVTSPTEVPDKITVFEFASSDEPSADNLIEALDEALRGQFNFTIDERRSYTNWGASGGAHEIIVAIVSGAAAGVTQIIADFARTLVGGSKKKSEVFEEGRAIQRATSMVKQYYEQRAELTIQSQTHRENVFELHVKDTFGISYDVSVDKVTGAISISR